MKRIIKSLTTICTLSGLALAGVFSLAGQANAFPLRGSGTDANYIGAGISAGVTDGGQGNDGATFGGNIQGRYAIPKSPLSLRGAVLFSDQTSAIIPLVSYDLPITNNANAYLGVGYSFVEHDGKPTPLGNTDAVVIALGGEAQLAKRLMVYADTKLGINAYQNSSASAFSIQTGLGYRF
jgi:hypothetical protein